MLASSTFARCGTTTTTSTHAVRGARCASRVLAATATATAEHRSRRLVPRQQSTSSSSTLKSCESPAARRMTTRTNALPALPALIASHYAWPALTAVAIAPVCLAYINPIYSFSVGYGASVLAASIAAYGMHAASGAAATTLLLAHIAGGVFYGARLAGFLYYRSVTWDEWKERAKNAPEVKQTGFAKQTMVIALCGLLYSCMASPMLWHAQNVNVINYVTYDIVIKAGVAAQWLGAVVEAVADQQKYNFKATERGKTRWCDTGLYAKCRHPNYLGEILFWVGTFVAGVPAMLTRPITFVPASVGLFFIVMLMLGAAKRGDKKQAEKYADNTEYKAWADNSCSLFPGN